MNTQVVAKPGYLMCSELRLNSTASGNMLEQATCAKREDDNPSSQKTRQHERKYRKKTIRAYFKHHGTDLTLDRRTAHDVVGEKGTSVE